MNLTTRFTWQGLIKSLVVKKRYYDDTTNIIILRSLSTVQRPQKDDINNNNNNNGIEMNKLYTYTKMDGYIRYSPFENITIPNCTIDKYVWKNINQFQDKIAIMCGITGHQYTYKQLKDHSTAFAIRLQREMNLKLNDIIAVCLPNIPEYPIATLGAIEAGLIVTTINPICTAEEISRQLLDSNSKLVIGTIDGYDVLKKAIDITQKTIQIICIKTPKSINGVQSSASASSDAIDFYDLIKLQDIDFNQLKIYNRCANELAFLPYSSGTTGLPKGVMLSHNNITSNCEQIQVNLPHTPLIQPTTNEFQDILPCVLPFYHIYGFTLCMSSKLSLGCKLITYPRFQQDTFLKSIEEQKATILHVVPPIMLYLTNNNMIKCTHLKSVRSVVSGAAPIGQLDAERFIKKFPHIEIIQGYGLTETSSAVSMNFKGNKNYASVGGPASNTQIKIVNIDCDVMDGRDAPVKVSKRNSRHCGLPPNEIGEIFVRGPQCMIGYYKNKKANKTIMMENGWMRTGDIGYYNDDGYLYITERLKELIKVKGYQVAPAELEELLRDHPMVDDAAVIGIPHLKYGEVPRAYIVLKPIIKQSINDVDGDDNNNNNNNENVCNENEFKTYVAERVSNYKRLDGGIEFINKIPRNLSGKILRKQLRDNYGKNINNNNNNNLK